MLGWLGARGEGFSGVKGRRTEPRRSLDGDFLVVRLGVGWDILGMKIFGILFLLMVGWCFGEVVVLEEYREDVEKSLVAAGENRGELEKALKDVPAGQAKGMQFLIAYMPAVDARSLKADFLLKNVALAYKARETFPWAKEVPEAVFLNDVLPYAALNERRDDWRGDFFERFGKIVKDAKTQEEALWAVNKAIKDEVKVEYSTKRKKADQSPYESMETGLASCTGLSILLNDAFRAVGIPSRIAGIAMWTTKRGNHNWVEVWTLDKKDWQFTEYYPDGSGELDKGWLLADAAKANEKSFVHSVYASSWKGTGLHFPLVWDMDRKDVPGVNVTRRYVELGGGDGDANVCELRIAYVKDGKRVAVPVVVGQGDLKIGEGMSPKVTDDMNRYFTVKVGKGQMYQVRYEEPGGEVKVKAVTTPKDGEFLLVELP